MCIVYHSFAFVTWDHHHHHHHDAKPFIFPPKTSKTNVFFKKMGLPWPLFIYFWFFQTNKTICRTNQFEKMSCPSSILHRDLNPWPLKHDWSLIATRPGLPPIKTKVYLLRRRFGSVDLSVPMILQPRVWSTSTTSLLFNFYFELYVKRTKINKKRPGLAHF